MAKFTVKSAFLFVISLFIFSLATRSVLAATVVSNTNMNGWAFKVQSANGVGTFVTGPATAPLGTGSARLFTGTNGNLSTAVHNVGFSGTNVASLTKVEYSTYSSSVGAANNKYPFIYMDVSTQFGPDTLYYDPEDQTQVPTLNTWQTWNTLDGIWHSSAFVGFTPGSMSSYLTAVGGMITVVNRDDGTGGIRMQAGPGGSGDVFDANVDNFTIGINGSDTTYDFEPTTATNNYSQIFYSDNNFTNQVGTSTTVNAPIKFNWGLGSPAAGVPIDNFSAKWEGTYDFNSGKYNFVGTSDNHLKVTVDGLVVFDKLTKGPGTGARLMTAGVHTVKVEYVHGTGASNMAFAMYPLPTKVFPFVGDCFDLNGDRIVNSGDQGFLASMVGTTAPINTLAGDLNNDGTINSGDQAILANKVGKPCPY